MSKKIIQIDKEQIKKTLKEQCVCYVLITCSSPSNDGKMEVEMSFEGEEDLAALLVENAAQVFDARIPRQESQ